MLRIEYDRITLIGQEVESQLECRCVGYPAGSRYLHPAFSIKLEESAIRNCFKDQHAAMEAGGVGLYKESPVHHES